MTVPAYARLAAHYDALQADFDPGAWVGFYERLWRKRTPRSVLDLACGTGSLTWELARRGYDVVAADASVEMLAVAAAKRRDVPRQPLFLRQPMEKLDLYGTVQAAVCSLDSVNYVADRHKLREAFRRVRLFLEPRGLFVFDILTPGHFARVDGVTETLEAKGVYCCWRSTLRGTLCTRELELFERVGARWERFSERHTQRVYAPEELEAWLAEAGFAKVTVYGDRKLRRPNGKDERLFIAARR
jgi:SAM-dependent methyltransferase